MRNHGSDDRAVGDPHGGMAADTACNIVTLPRHGKPPLRLRARLVRRVVQARPGEEETWLEIWARPGGRAAAAFVWPSANGVFRDAVQADSLDGLCALLENMAVPAGSPGPAAASAPPSCNGEKTRGASAALDRLSKRLHDAQARRRFALLLDEALS